MGADHALTLPRVTEIGILEIRASPGLEFFKCSARSFIILILILLGALPRWRHGAGWATDRPARSA
jgi:hypothetical protein